VVVVSAAAVQVVGLVVVAAAAADLVAVERSSSSHSSTQAIAKNINAAMQYKKRKARQWTGLFLQLAIRIASFNSKPQNDSTLPHDATFLSM
jgi:hypothetical protein